MTLRFVLHRHATGRSHFDLRLIAGERIRSWSLLKAPPAAGNEQRLAIERENFPPEDLRRKHLYESAFGGGRVSIWDEGEAELILDNPRHLILQLSGRRLNGRYELRRMSWYPGNRWLLRKSEEADSPAGTR